MPKTKKYVPPPDIIELEENIAKLVNLITANVAAMGGDMMALYFTDKNSEHSGVVLVGVGAPAVAGITTFMNVLNSKDMVEKVRESPRPN